MEVFDESNRQAQTAWKAMNQSGLTLGAVWMRYFSITGVAGEYEVDAYLNGSMELPCHERNLLAHAINELIAELPSRRLATYSEDESGNEEDRFNRP